MALTTAKSIQLLDGNGVNISPVTDITSLYYEVTKSIGDVHGTSITSRKYVYTGFPVSVNISNQIQELNRVIINQPHDLVLYEEQGDTSILYKITNVDDTDIIVTNLSMSLIQGTSYYQLNANNYNLSNILSYYTPLDMFNTRMYTINKFVNDVSTGLYNTEVIFNDLVNMESNGQLIPNKMYIVTNYYYNNGGCMKIPSNNYYNGITEDNKKYIYVKALNKNKLSPKIYNIYDPQQNKFLDITGKFEIDSSLLKITYLKDKYNNEAPFDFYNITYNNDYMFNYNNENALLNENFNIKNNKINLNIYNSNNSGFIIFDIQDNTNVSISNNTIGEYNDIIVKTNIFENNEIGNNNQIISRSKQVQFKNVLIDYNNTIQFLANNYILTNVIIKSNNKLEFDSENIIDVSFNNLFIYSNNIVSIEYSNQDNNNIIIMNNNNCNIIAVDNLLIDNVTNNNFVKETNSAYLYNQNIYAKSFNTIN